MLKRSETAHSITRFSLPLALVILIVLSAARIYTKRPFYDEGWYANPAINLIENGHTGVSVADPHGVGVLRGENYPAIDQHFYQWLPTQQVNLAAWSVVFGFNLFSVRANALIWGMIALLSWWIIVRELTDPATAALAALLYATHPALTGAASDGRPDMMCAALWSAGLATYLSWRERHFTAALVGGFSLVLLSCMTHPMGAIGLACLLTLILVLDRRKLNLRTLAFAAVPFVVAALTAAAYILPDYATFRAQFTVLLVKRVGSNPPTFLGRFASEIGRYGDFYFPSYARGFSGVLRLLVAIVYAASLVLFLAWSSVRRRYPALLLLAAVALLSLSIVDAGRMYYYVVHTSGALCGTAAAVMICLWRQRGLTRLAAVSSIAFLLAVQCAWNLAMIRSDYYHASFQPMANFLTRELKPSSTVAASPELGFVLGFHPERLRDDALLGYKSGRLADYFVIPENSYGTMISDTRAHVPEFARYIDTLLAQQYEQVYKSDFYQIYRRKAPATSDQDLVR
jgi:4-amino-4-deoxy-L-arabinose transferase-like glycosyltransferase